MTCDVVISGGGIAGLTLAYALARQDLNVVVLERNAPGFIGNGADLLKPSGIRVLTALGIMKDALDKGRLRTRLKAFHDGMLVATVDYARLGDPSFFLIVPYSILCGLLLDKLAAMPNVKIYFRTRILALDEQAGGKLALHLSDAQHIKPRIIVGADGSGSDLRTRLFGSVDRVLYPQKMYLATFPLVPSVEECNRLYVDACHGLAYFYPISRTQARLVLGFPRGEANVLLHHARNAPLVRRLSAFVSESGDALEAVSGISDFHGIPIAKMHAQRYFQHNVVLLGNAIHSVHPITGQGMNLAIEDAGALASQLAEFFAGQQSLQHALQAYADERMPINEAIVNYGDRLATTFHDRALFADAFSPALQGSSRQSEHMGISRKACVN